MRVGAADEQRNQRVSSAAGNGLLIPNVSSSTCVWFLANPNTST